MRWRKGKRGRRKARDKRRSGRLREKAEYIE